MLKKSRYKLKKTIVVEFKKWAALLLLFFVQSNWCFASVNENSGLPLDQTIYLEKQKLISLSADKKPYQRNILASLLVKQDKLVEAKKYLKANNPCIKSCSEEQVLSAVKLQYVNFLMGPNDFNLASLDTTKENISSLDKENLNNELELIAGDIYLHKGLYNEAYTSFLQAKKSSAVTKDSFTLVRATLGLSKVYLRLGFCDSSIAYLEELNQLSRFLSSTSEGTVNNILVENYIKQEKYDYARLYQAKASAASLEANFKSGVYLSLLNKFYLNLALEEVEVSARIVEDLRQALKSSTNKVLDASRRLCEAELLIKTGELKEGTSILDRLLAQHDYLLPLHKRRKAALLQISSYYDLGEYKKAFELNQSNTSLIHNASDQALQKSFELLAPKIRSEVQNNYLASESSTKNRTSVTPFIINMLLVFGLLVVGILIFRNFQISRNDVENLEHKNNALLDLNQELKKINEALDDSRQAIKNQLDSAQKQIKFVGTKLRSHLAQSNAVVKTLENTSLLPEQLELLTSIKARNKKLGVVVDDFSDKLLDNKLNKSLGKSLIQVDSLMEEILSLFHHIPERGELTFFIHSPMEEMFRGDNLRIRQILINLIELILQGSKDGKVGIEIKRGELLRAKTDDARLAKIQFSVSSNYLAHNSNELQLMLQENPDSDNPKVERISQTKDMASAMGGKLSIIQNEANSRGFIFELMVAIPSHLIIDHQDDSKNEEKAFPSLN